MTGCARPIIDRASAIAFIRRSINDDDRFYGANRLVLLALLSACDFRSFTFNVKRGVLMEWVASEDDLDEALDYLAAHEAIEPVEFSRGHVGGVLLTAQRAVRFHGWVIE